jgi:hypothetical protein
MNIFFALAGFLATVGFIPFSLGFFAQFIFRKRQFHFLSGWIVSLIIVLSQWYFMHGTMLSLGEEFKPSIIGSYLILGLFSSLGIKLGFPIGIGTPLAERPSHTTNRTDHVVSGSAVIDRFDQAEPVRETE